MIVPVTAALSRSGRNLSGSSTLSIVGLRHVDGDADRRRPREVAVDDARVQPVGRSALIDRERVGELERNRLAAALDLDRGDGRAAVRPGGALDEEDDGLRVRR